MIDEDEFGCLSSGRTHESSFDLLKKYPAMRTPIRCDNGCGAVIELLDAFMSYDRDEHGERKLICECCAAEKGHVHEDLEEPEETPVCHRKPKKRLR